jgi:hypothetical protein
MTRLIRHGTVARVRGRLMPDSAIAPGYETIDTLDFKFEVLTGRYCGCRFWGFFPVDVSLWQRSGWFDTRRWLRAMIDSALGLNPRDLSKSTQPKRILNSLAEFDRVEFIGQIAVEKIGPVRVNRLAGIITPDDPPRWRRLMGRNGAAEWLPMRSSV